MLSVFVFSYLMSFASRKYLKSHFMKFLYDTVISRRDLCKDQALFWMFHCWSQVIPDAGSAHHCQPECEKSPVSQGQCVGRAGSQIILIRYVLCFPVVYKCHFMCYFIKTQQIYRSSIQRLIIKRYKAIRYKDIKIYISILMPTIAWNSLILTISSLEM